ncbi:MAG TPA: hypothetical protein VGY30_03250 [Solirubrobacteraceae bacterium]|nr:hypothetical protein [Solirubrobacteraceae bacterium]
MVEAEQDTQVVQRGGSPPRASEATDANGRATGTDTVAAERWSPFDVASLVEDVIQESGPIKQWVVTGEIPTNRLVERVLNEDPTSVAAQQRADFAEAQQLVTSLSRARGARTREPLWLRLMPAILALATLVFLGLLTTWISVGKVEFTGSGAAVSVILFVMLEATLAGSVRLLKGRFRHMVVEPHEAGVARAEHGAERSLAALHDTLIEQSVRPALYTMANENRGDLYRVTLGRVQHEGLAQLDDSRATIDTDTKRRLDYLLREMPGGSIGLAGPRGAGKSTLMRAACPSARSGPIFGVMVAAPVEFEARDFILHLFSEVCQKVLGTEIVDELRRHDPIGEGIGDRRHLMWFAAFLFAITAIAGLALAVHSSLPGRSHVNWTLILGLALTAFGSLGYLRMIVRTRELRRNRERRLSIEAEQSVGSLGSYIPKSPEEQKIFSLASSRLKDIWFQQSYTRGWSGSLSMPIGLTAGVEGATALARQQMSLPDIVAELRRLIASIASDKVTVRIGIDELDKIESPEAAGRFMNEIKILFGISNCFFLVSVSEDAMSTFERRGLPFRDVFDSSFDDIVRVGHLNAAGTIELVQSHVIGMGVPFILLGHCMTGGLARDLIRVVRDMVSLAPGDGDERALSDICSTLLYADVRGKAEACVVACSRLPHGPAVERLQTWLRAVPQAGVTSAQLLAHCAGAESELAFLHGVHVHDQKARTATGLATEFLAFCYFSSTLLEFFTDARSGDSYREVAEDIAGRCPIDRLAEARQAFAVHPRAAWDAVSEFRDEQGLLPQHKFPAFG